MLGLPWWAWIVVLVILALFILSLAGRLAYRRLVRREFVAFLKEQNAEYQVVGVEGDTLLLHSEENGQCQVYLGKLYAAIATLRGGTPEIRREVYEHFARSVLVQAPDSLDLETHGDQILPRLVHPAFFVNLPEGVALPRRPLQGTPLSVVYVLDHAENVMYLTVDHVAELGIEADELHELALRNLRPTFPAEAVRAAAEGQSASAIKRMDSYDGTRLLLVPEHLHEGEQIAAVVSDRDTLFLAPVPPDGDWGKLATLARTRPSPDAYPLLDRPLQVRSEGVELV